MTLQRLLILIVFGLFLIMFAGTFYISIQNVRNYLNTQLVSHAQDTATSLGLSLTPHIKKKDMATMNSMVDAVFDRGDYRLIEIVDVKGESMIKRDIPVVINQVPPWFIDNLIIETPAGEALVMSGWSQAATVYVSSHPGYAYFELWQNAKQTFIWFLLTGFAIALCGYITLRSLLKPLRHVEQQANAICSREYPVQEHLPWTRELRSVVMAMNKMVMRVKEMFQEQADMTERLQQEVFKDGLTGMGNRTHFEQQFASLIESQEEMLSGCLLLIQVHGLQAQNEVKGYQAGDDLICQSALHIQSVLKPYGEFLAARLTGGDFVALVGAITADEGRSLAQQLLDQLKQLTEEDLIEGDDVAHIGVAFYEQAQDSGALLAMADTALRNAQTKGPNAVDVMDTADSAVHTATQWRDLLSKALETERIHLVFQRVDDVKGRLMHTEALARIQSVDGQDYSAGLFVPMAIRHHLSDQLDRAVVKHVLNHLSQSNSDQTIAVNLSPMAVSDDVFQDWLKEELKCVPRLSKLLVFELSEYAVLRDTESAKRFAESLQALGCQFAIDHFGRGLSSFGYLSSMPVAYLKLDARFSREIGTDADTRFFLNSLIRTAHSIDIPVIAEAVESNEQKQALLDLAVDGLQGYLIAKPE